jgi:hypothetical protein
MGSTLANCAFCPSKDFNYLVGGNVCNAFVIGNVGDPDDFFLIGAPVPGESTYPLLTGNILDSEGHLLFKLVRNVLVVNPQDCHKILAGATGYEIQDATAHPILKVHTEFMADAGLNEPSWITKIEATFYNKNGEMVFQATPNSAIIKSPAAFGWNGRNFTYAVKFPQPTLELLPVFAQSGGAINELVQGEHTNETIQLEGKLLNNATLSDCEIIVASGRFVGRGQNAMKNCRIKLSGEALNLSQFIQAVQASTPSAAKL